MTIDEIRHHLVTIVPDHLSAHWEYSRSGTHPDQCTPRSESCYLHVRGGNRALKIRVSDHDNGSYSSSDFDLRDSHSDEYVKATLVELATAMADLTPYNTDVEREKLEREWTSEIEHALKQPCKMEIYREVKNRIFDGYMDFEWLTSTVTDLPETEDDGEKQNRLLEKWHKAICRYAKGITQGQDVDFFREYNALKFTQGDDRTRVLEGRAEYGNADAARELERREFVLKYLAEEHLLVITPSEFAVDEFLRDVIDQAVADICAFPDDYPELFA